ncbi:STAS/SEC14 domain-containing protein [Mariprofundus micogutta]|nr:STAS/SEC14 domain-containing protein [Mariprofundus micogutta]
MNDLSIVYISAMPMSSHYDDDLNIIFASSIGEVSLDDLMSYYSMISSYDLKEGYRVFVDYSDISLKLAERDIPKMAEARNELVLSPDRTKIAVYCNKDLVFGLARMYQMLLDQEHYDLRVFRDKDEARKWLGI